MRRKWDAWGPETPPNGQNMWQAVVVELDDQDHLAHRQGPLSRRERTHERLIAATTDLLRDKGLGGLTVSAITRRVGVHHSLFYQHFKDLDACMAVAAERVLERLAPVDRELRRALLAQAVTDRVRLASHFRDALDRWMGERPFVQLLLAHRLERSTIGAAFAGALSKMRSETAAELWEISQQLGLRSNRNNIETLAGLHLTHFLWALESLDAGRATDHGSLALVLADLYIATNNTFYERNRRLSPNALLRAAFTDEQREAMRADQRDLRRIVAQASDRELVDRFGDGDLTAAGQWLVARMRDHFLPGSARPSVVLGYRVRWQDESVTRMLVFQEETCELAKPEDCGPPQMLISGPLRTMFECISGLRHFDECHRAGDVEIEGDVLLGAESVGWFFHA